MLSELRYWRDPGYWRWLWHERAGTRIKLAIVLLFALALGIAGYLGARGLGASDAAATFTTQRVVTVVRKARPGRPPKVVTLSETVTEPGKTNVVTVRRNGRTVVVRSPERTVTVHGRVQRRVVTVPGKAAVVRTVTANRPTTVVRSGPTVTTPGSTVTTPGQTVTTPGQTVTTQGPTVTVTRTVTEPAQTVTQTVTQTTTQLATVTVTVPGTAPAPGP